MRRDGETIYVELTFAIVHGAEGAVIGALAHARDITERWGREREQRRQLREMQDRLSETVGASEVNRERRGNA